MAREPLSPGFHLWAIRDGLAVDCGRVSGSEAGALELAERASAYSRATYSTLGVRYEAHAAGSRPSVPNALGSAVYLATAQREERARAAAMKRSREQWGAGRPAREKSERLRGLEQVTRALSASGQRGR